jgi:hypothetical protein
MMPRCDEPLPTLPLSPLVCGFNAREADYFAVARFVQTAACGMGFPFNFLALLNPLTVPCMYNEYSPNPNIRAEDLLFQREHIGGFEHDWQKDCVPNTPSHMTNERVHGGIGP